MKLEITAYTRSIFRVGDWELIIPQRLVQVADAFALMTISKPLIHIMSSSISTASQSLGRGLAGRRVDQKTVPLGSSGHERKFLQDGDTVGQQQLI